MKRLRTSTPLALLIAATLPLVLGTVGRVDTVEGADDWREVEKEFKDLFKTKNPIKDRQKAVSRVGRFGDVRGVKLLLGALKKQEKHSLKMRKDWEDGEEEWAEKTERIERQFEEKRKRAIARGETPTIDLGSEEGRWLGGGNQEGEMVREKRRLEKMYQSVLQEEEFQTYMLRNMGRILNGIEGEDFEKAVKPFVRQALSSKDRNKEMYVKALGYIKGEPVTEALFKFADDNDLSISLKALESLGRQNTEAGMLKLIEFLDAGQWQVRAAAVHGLSFFKNPVAMDALLAQAAKEEGSVRRRCFGAMATIVGEPVKATIESWQSWWRSNKEEWVDKWSRVPASGPVQEDPVVIPVASEESEGTSFYGIKTDSKHIIFVADVSGSMRMPEDAPDDFKAPIQTCKEELINAIKTLSAQDEDERGAASFNVVLFSTFVEVYKERKMVIATRKNKEKVFEWLEEKVIADGMTNAYDALEQAFNIIGSEKRSAEKGADTIFFMTDGHPNRGKFWEPELILREIKRINAERKITIHVIGVGPAAAAMPWLQQLAAENNGKYINRED